MLSKLHATLGANEHCLEPEAESELEWGKALKSQLSPSDRLLQQSAAL